LTAVVNPPSPKQKENKKRRKHWKKKACTMDEFVFPFNCTKNICCYLLPPLKKRNKEKGKRISEEKEKYFNLIYVS